MSKQQDLVSFPLEHDATPCPVEGCDLPFKHGPHGPDHPEACGCFYSSAGDYRLCRDHEATGFTGLNKEADHAPSVV